MTALFYIMISVFFGYIAAITLFYGVQTSVSESYYRLPRNLQMSFTIVTWGYALPAAIIGLDISGSGLVFLAGAGICFVGAAPAFHKIGMERTVHTIGAITGIGAMLLFLIAMGWWVLVVLFAALCGLFYLIDKKNIVWWAEISAMLVLIAFYTAKLNIFG